ncbi:peptidoglycan DD-metalloendopeptidase family protein [Lichenifustis flavocetrariae]|nr:peptidoglycan DD-metalloendopeptidase family protein [Lichenifustis flavocetrariae]
MSGCSSDVTRFGDPFGNPFSTASADQPKARRHVASSDVIPAGRTPPVSSAALAPRAVSVASLAPSRPALASSAREPVSTETTGSIDRGPTHVASGASFGGWSSAGGTPIQVADGETAEILAKRYGVPENAFLQVNGLHSAAEVRPGSRVTIPIYSASGQSTASPRVAEAVPRAEPEPVHTPRASQTKTASLVHQVKKPVALAAKPAKVVSTKRVAEQARIHTEKTPVATASMKPQTLGKLPASTVATTKSTGSKLPATNVVAKSQIVPAAQTAAVKPSKTAAAPMPAATTVVAQAPALAPSAPAQAPASAVADNNPEFRWPARGRIIQGFKGGTGGNDGINIAVPEGTAVKAAEGGVVAYAGSELKGYGNLVLIRHPNGFVSAYANNGEIDVKRGETVKRGQMIAKSGQSGNVSSPQLHFELRKGSTPVDPTQYLAGL